MAIIRKDSMNNNDDQAVIQRKIFKTWHEVMEYMQIETVELPWNVDGITALRILREKYAKRFKCINDSFLDEVVDAYQTRSSGEQLAALGAGMQELKLRFCHLNLNPPQYTVFAVESDNTRDYLNKWKEVLTRRQFFNMIDTFAMHHGETLDRPADDVRIPMSFVQVIGNQNNANNGCEYILDGKYLVITFETVERYNPEPVRNMRIYDLKSWPLLQIDFELSFDRENIEPYTLKIKADSGEIIYVGDDIERARSWKKTIINEKGQFIPVYEEEDDEDDGIWKGLSLGEKKNLTIPEIEDATPFFTIDDCIVYYYDNDDIDSREPKDDNLSPSRSVLQKRRERRKMRNTLIEYNTKTRTYRTLNFPAAAYINADDLILYKNKWIVIPDGIFNRDASYILRLWDPRTHECLRLTQKDMGCHNIQRIIPADNGDIYILLDDGRLCRLDVDLSDWLKKDLQQHKVLLDDWQKEKRRGYENFPEDTNRFVRLRRQPKSDRMLITFEDDKTYDILLKE